MSDTTKMTMKEIRQYHGMAIPEISHYLGIRENTLYKWERGDTMPDLETAFAFAEKFGMKVDDINWWPPRDEE